MRPIIEWLAVVGNFNFAVFCVYSVVDHPESREAWVAAAAGWFLAGAWCVSSMLQRKAPSQ